MNQMKQDMSNAKTVNHLATTLPTDFEIRKLKAK
jgi:hypothetical protein